jgi:hypothetical protein
MEKHKNCDNPKKCREPKVPGSDLCHACRNAALCACKSDVKPKLRREDGDSELRLSNDVYQSCGGSIEQV